MSRNQIEIERHHRNRLAIVYVRTASVSQDPEDLARLEYQRDQSGHARAWGWPTSAIRVIDDIGQSGTMTTARPGFRQLCQMIEAGQLGLVLVRDLTRLSRSVADLLAFLRLCQKTDTLVAVDGILADPSTMYLRKSSPRRVVKNAGSVAFQRKIREIFR